LRPPSAGAGITAGNGAKIDERAGDDIERAQLHQTECPAVLEKLKTWLWSQAVLKTLSIGKAAAYAISNWQRLTRFVDDQTIMRPSVAFADRCRSTKSPWAKSRRGTQVAAVFYSLMETAKLQGIHPGDYLLEAARAAARGEILLPWSITK
jgi:transposase